LEVLPLDLLREHEEARDMLRDMLGSLGQERGWSDSMPWAGLTLRKRKSAPEILRAVEWMAKAPGAGGS
jgi:hypothetical protein